MSLKLDSTAICCSEAELTADKFNITIGKQTVVHPTAKIIAEKYPFPLSSLFRNVLFNCSLSSFRGPIEIGSFNIIEELAVIINTSTTTLKIGNYNSFEVLSCSFL
jgi:hypothetical protein